MSWLNLFIPSTPQQSDSIQDVPSSPLKQETKQLKKAPVVPPTTYTGSNSTILPSWVRPYVQGEQLDDSKERLCASPQCGAVLMRQGQSDYSWSNKRYCCAGCRNGKPPIPASHTTDRLQ